MICGHLKHKGDYEKFRISEEERAKSFLKAAVFFQDEVYVRTCDLQDAHSFDTKNVSKATFKSMIVR